MTAPSAAISIRNQRIARPWRWAFVAYAITLTVATHWPNLRLGPEVPASDKMIHLVGFGVLALLLWQTRWFASRWLIWIMAIGWGALDEISQGIPALNRTVTWEDLVANALGATVAAALLWAARPVGDPRALNQQRLRLMEFSFEEMFSRRAPWLVGLAALGAGAACIFIASRFLAGTSMGKAVLIIMGACAVALYVACRGLWLKQMRTLRANRPCLSCGSDAFEKSPGMAIPGLCPVCGSIRAVEVFDMPLRPPWRRMLRVGLGPVLLAVIVILLMFVAILATPVLYDWLLSGAGPGSAGSRWVGAPRLARWLGRLPPELTRTIDASVYLLIVAVVVRFYRRRLARWYDRAAICEACGHDLRATPTDERGRGQCGECGRLFHRRPESSTSAPPSEAAEKPR